MCGPVLDEYRITVFCSSLHNTVLLIVVRLCDVSEYEYRSIKCLELVDARMTVITWRAFIDW